MFAFLLIVLMPAAVLFALMPLVAFGLMLESVTPKKQGSLAPSRRDAFSIGRHAELALHDACAPASA